MVAEAGYPGTRAIPATSWLLSLLSLKLTRTRRVSHVDDLLADPAAGLLSGMATLAKKSAVADYSYRLSHDHQRRFLAALDKTMTSSGLATSDQAVFDLDFHAVMHWGPARCWKSTTCPNAPSEPEVCSPSSPRAHVRERRWWHPPLAPGPRITLANPGWSGRWRRARLWGRPAWAEPRRSDRHFRPGHGCPG